MNDLFTLFKIIEVVVGGIKKQLSISLVKDIRMLLHHHSGEEIINVHLWAERPEGSWTNADGLRSCGKEPDR